MKPTLFIDFDGTLCHDKYWRSLPSDIFDKLQVFLFQDNNNLVVDWMTGLYTSEEINTLLVKELSIDKHYLWRIFVADCMKMHVSQSTLERIETLREKYHTILITDNMDCFDRYVKCALNLDFYFDTIVNSYTEQKLKSEEYGSIFQKYLVGSFKDAVLIDNSQKICNLFSSLGGTVCQITEEESIDLHLSKL